MVVQDDNADHHAEEEEGCLGFCVLGGEFRVFHGVVAHQGHCGQAGGHVLLGNALVLQNAKGSD